MKGLNISETDLQMIASRKSFRGEEFFDTSNGAIARARERSLTTNKVVCVAKGENIYSVHTHGVELKKFVIFDRFKHGKSIMINLDQAKKQAATLSTKDKNKVYVIANGTDDYFTSSAPFNGCIGYCLDGKYVPINNKQINIIEMAKTAKKVAKKAAPKKAVKKVAAKNTSTKAVTKAKKEVIKKITKATCEGKVVDISIADMRKKMAEGFFYKDPQGTRQSENYLASRSKQDHVRTGMLEFKASKD